jgi:hypothetical protein
MKFELGRSVKEQKRLKQPVSSSASSVECSRLCLTAISLSSDFENKFVCGEIMSYTDLQEHGSEAAVKAAGKLRQQGKPYESMYLSHLLCRNVADEFVVIDGDIAYWKSGA